VESGRRARGKVSPGDVRAFAVPLDLAGVRLDVALARLAPDLSRARVQRLVAEGRVRLAGRVAKPAVRLRAGDALEVEVPAPEPSGLVAQDLPLAASHIVVAVADLTHATGTELAVPALCSISRFVLSLKIQCEPHTLLSRSTYAKPNWATVWSTSSAPFFVMTRAPLAFVNVPRLTFPVDPVVV
jgi:hypothetical protein